METYERLVRAFAEEGRSLPQNRGREGKLRELDCMVINACIDAVLRRGAGYDTVRGAFEEGALVYPGR